MRSRDDGKKQPCFNCGTPTAFLYDHVGARGGRHTYPCCPDCGERPSGLDFKKAQR